MLLYEGQRLGRRANRKQVDYDDPKILFWEGRVKEEICFLEVPHFLAKVVDLRLYYCILEENSKTTVQEETLASSGRILPL